MEVESGNYGKSVDAAHHNRSNRMRKKQICLAVVALVLFLILLLVILGLTVFKAKRPVTTVNSVSLEDLQVSLNILQVRVNINVTLDVNLSIKNPNRVGFKYANSSALVSYRGQVVGEAPIPAGEISAHQTLPMNLTLTVLADRLLSNSNLFSDVASGTLPLSTYTRISGKVHILVFNIHVVTYTTCDLTIDIANRTVSNQSCHYKSSL